MTTPGHAVSAPNGIVYFHYRTSPFARRVVWYLALRNINYAGCAQPEILPRPDLKALGLHYRRTPTMAVGRDVYIDSRLIIQRLEELYPPSAEHPAISSKESAGLASLLNKFAVDAGLMARAVALLPLGRGKKAEAFRNDRNGWNGPGTTLADTVSRKPESIAHLRQCFEIAESLFVDGRDWVAGTSGPSLADLEGVWCFDFIISWLNPPSQHFSDKLYPKTYSWVKRFGAAVNAAQARAKEPLTVSGADAVATILAADFTDTTLHVDGDDPLQLQRGASVKLYPTDGGGFGHKDVGELIKLTKDEVAIAIRAPTGEEVRVHAPRWQFRIEADGAAKL